ncbi:hypothetical protein Sste5346_000896 [Sporothrix stenoceras]|uniref:Uncharacterized protein n=1 Tax=Sporothrix stenoceras TaxID=5173 RepID=A0ABR3ZS06_9PEZI
MGPTAASNRAAGTTPARASQSAASAGPLFSTTLFNTTSTTTTGSTANTATLNTPYPPSGPSNTATSTQSRPRPATSAGEASRTARPASSFSSYSSASSSSLLLHRDPPSIPPPPLPTLPAVPPLPLTTGGDRHKPNVLTKERRPSLSKKPSFTRSRGLTTTSTNSTSTSNNANSSGGSGSGVSSLFHHQRHKSASSIAFGGSNSSHSNITGSPKKGSTENNTADNRPPPLPSDWATATASAAQRISVSPNIQVVPPPSSPTASPVKTWSTFTTATSATAATSSSSSTTATTIVPTTPVTASFTPNFSHPNSSNNKMLGAVLATPATTGLGLPMPANLGMNSTVTSGASENAPLLIHIQEMVNKRISTLDYLRKAHEGRVYWFNTLRFDRPDINRMSYFDSRRLARRATNYLLLGLSLPAVVDLNSANVTELLRSLGALLAEFESFQQLHSETGSGSSAASSLSRAARLPNMFRRATPGSKVRRTSSSAASGSNDFGSSFDGGMSGGANGGMNSLGGPPGSVGSMVPPSSSGGLSSSGGGGLADSMGGSALTLVNSESAGSVNGGAGNSSFGNGVPPLPSGAAGIASNHGGLSSSSTLGGLSGGLGTSSMSGSVASTAFATYYDNNTDLLPGEEYTFLLTPSLPFDPDFFETFATLCDVLIDSYQRILSLMPNPRECTPLVVELFGKADARVRKLLVQGVVKEFEDHSRGGVKMEVANVGKVVLGGLM